MAFRKITDGIYSVGIKNPALRVFDIVMTTDYGTTYNSYIVKGNDKTALIDSCHPRFFNQYLENIQEVVPVEKIDYIVCNHTEPDHSGVMARILAANPDAVVLATTAGSNYLKNITNCADLKVQVVKDGQTVDLGGKTLKFLVAPNLHWPDSMFTWIEEDKTLFPCDFLGSHYCEVYDFDTSVTYGEKYESAFKGYYDAIFGPFPSFVQKGLDKIKDLDIRFACPSHGPVLTPGCRLEYAMEQYRQWSTPVQRENKLIPVFYCTAYGNTEKIANSIREGILSVLPNAECVCFNLIENDMGQMHGLINAADAVAIGSPTINREAVPPVWILLAGVDAINSGKKPALVFGSYGWTGEAVPNLIQRLTALKMKVFGEGMKVAFVPSEEDLKKAFELGQEFAKSL